MAWKVINSKYAFDNKFVKVRQDECLLPNGSSSDFFTVEIRDWALVVAFTPSKEIVLVKQYRHSAGQELIELPAGVMKKDEKPEDAIKREFLEETGMGLKQIEELGAWFTMSGKSNCKTTAFFGITMEQKGAQQLDKEENIHILFKKPKEVLQMIATGEIKTAPYIAGILAAKEKHPEYFK
ncbi:MAG: NUDIX hydrolase [Candidatus Diapherotrites archaeon]|uniref:NUDIX hydrolase n=1 Tax=Candidatus Iainarchaeum sp. TaxID=3101447 RepID=A0A8T4L3S9_9ARCH|nr:NUDIX hydrolase [Candidatus Diapherotrites archaeon]